MAAADAKPFDVLTVPLTGSNLIESSAGTGKTWTIAALYVRLVLERDLPVGRILVVTYTVAATEELRGRIRARLVELREAFVKARDEKGDAFTGACLAKFDRAQAIERLTRAVTGFDEAAIHTIHGFCQRALAEHAFESAMPFRTELLPDQSEILQHIADDFWRRELYRAPRSFVRYAVEQGLSPESLAAQVASHLGKIYLKVEGPDEPEGLVDSWERLRAAYAQAKASWHTEREDILATLARHPGRTTYRADYMASRTREMDEHFAEDEPGFKLPRALNYFTASKVAESAKGKPHETHPFFAQCEELAVASAEFVAKAEAAIGALKKRFFDYAREELARRKARDRVQSYDDLLINLKQALCAPGGARLAERLRERYAAALIDEFQDTDPIQYEIFARIYDKTEAPVFFVGDPKQAIYSFRGADVYAYLNARKAVSRRATLSTNRRSTPELIAAINALYEGSAQPFLFGAIPFPRHEAAEREGEALTIEGDPDGALWFWLLESGGEKPWRKMEASQRIAAATAAEIVRLLNRGQERKALIGGRELDGRDIAVLVRTHRQAEIVKRALRAVGVASVEYSQASVFESREALELERVLMAVAEPGREALVRAALATEMLGGDGASIQALREDEAAWQRRLETFHELHLLWRDHGFIRMFRALLAREGVAARLLGYSDGERRLTNLNHLAELLQAHSVEERGGMEGLILWLAEHRRNAGQGEESVLRLESDEHLVKIVTVHASKGLEYPIVFCPFLWDGDLKTSRASALSFHDPAGEDQAVLDLGTAHWDARLTLACREEFAESLRLAYVALTRAKYRCYVAWGRIAGYETSALAWLLLGQGLEQADDPVAALEERVEALDDAGVADAVRRCAERAGGAIRVAPLPEPSGERFVARRSNGAALAARRFRGIIVVDWRVGSFSSLAAQAPAEAPDHDELREVVPRQETLDDRSIFAFPRGTRAGSCLHAIFEHLDFAGTGETEIARLVERKLNEYRFPLVWTPAVVGVVQAVLDTPLDGQGAVRLRDIGLEQRINEMEFYYPVAHLDAGELRNLLLAHDFGSPAIREAIGRLSFGDLRGFLKGYIDLVFEAGGRYYIADYKSNWLGGSLEHYRRAALEQEMADAGYYLQYLLYSVALHRYLGARLPGYSYERHMGGVYYLFLRGIDPAAGSEYGIFHDRPPAALIEALDAYLRGAGPEEGDARAA